MIISAIICMGRRGEIGRDGHMPWPRLPEDVKWFREHTLGKAVILGRKTWDRLPVKPLPLRMNIVLTRSSPEFMGLISPVDWNMVGSPEAALKAAEDYGCPEAVVIGGAATYRAFEDRIERWYLTLIGAIFPDADTHFEIPQSRGWVWDMTSVRESGADGPYPLEFLELGRSR